jgi:hypothetical protein
MTENHDHDYAAGVRDGRLASLEKIVEGHDSMLDKHDRRFGSIERILYTLIGLWCLAEVVPRLSVFNG